MNHYGSNVFKLKKMFLKCLGLLVIIEKLDGSKECSKDSAMAPQSIRLLFCSVSENANWLTFKPNPHKQEVDDCYCE